MACMVLSQVSRTRPPSSLCLKLTSGVVLQHMHHPLLGEDGRHTALIAAVHLGLQ